MVNFLFNDTIVALSTAPFESALALIRMSGKEAHKILRNIFSVPISEDQGPQIIHGQIINDGEVIDDVVVNLTKAPKTFTGEDTVEISCHGNLVIINKIIEACIKFGARLAEKGEFTKKAFINGKIDLIQAESINDLIRANSESAVKVALQGLKGSVSNKIKDLKNDLLDIISQIEVNIDYPEYEDIEQLTNKILLPRIKILSEKSSKILEEAETGQMIRDGIKVAIVGKPNAGKSSLLNALLEEEKAIVTDIAGTTRDIVEGRIIIGGLPFLFLDTAGLRNPTNKIESLGVERSKKAISEADIIINVIDASKTGQKIETGIKKKPHIIVLNKKDIGIKSKIEGISISALKKDNIEELKKAIVKKTGIELKEYDQYALLSNTRQIGLMQKAKRALEDASLSCKKMVPVDLIYIDLRLALDALLEILGEKSNIDLDNEVFSRFCVGK